MALAQRFVSAATTAASATALVFGLAANANAAPPTIDPRTADLSKPVDGCVVSTPNMTAKQKLDYILTQQDKIVAVETNKLGVDGKGGLSSTKFAVSTNLSGRDGYIIDSSNPLSQDITSKGFCLSPVKFLIARPLGNQEIPAAINKGELGIALTNATKKGMYTVAFGKHPNGAIFAVDYNAKDNRGGLIIADGYGNKAGNAELYRDLTVRDDYKALLASANKPVQVDAIK